MHITTLLQLKKWMKAYEDNPSAWKRYNDFQLWGREKHGVWTWMVEPTDPIGIHRVMSATIPTSLNDKIMSVVQYSYPRTKDYYLTSSHAFTTSDLEHLSCPKHDYHTYVIEAVGLNMVKIGKAKNVTKRLKQLQTGSPLKLQVLHCFDLDCEGDLHRHFASHRVNGEWFAKCDYIMEYLRSLSATA